MTSAHEQSIASLAKSLFDEIVDASDPLSERAVEILAGLQAESTNTTQPMTIAILEKTKIGKMLTKTAKACKRHWRTSDARVEWDVAVSAAEKLLAGFKEAANEEMKLSAKKKTVAAAAESQKEGLPASASAYRTRLVGQKKDMYKDPPALPPSHIVIESSYAAKPKRNKSTGELTFVCGEDDSIEDMLKDFHPNRTPEEVLRAGAFGGTYFRRRCSDDGRQIGRWCKSAGPNG